MLNMGQAKAIIEAHDIETVLRDTEKMSLMERQNPTLANAYKALLITAQHDYLNMATQIISINESETLDSIYSSRCISGKQTEKNPKKLKTKKSRPKSHIDTLILDALRKRHAPTRAADLWRGMGGVNSGMSQSMVYEHLVKLEKAGTITGRKVRSKSGPTWEFSTK